MFQVGKCAPGPWERSLSPSRSSGHSPRQAASAREGLRRRVRGPGSSFLQNLGGLSCAWGDMGGEQPGERRAYVPQQQPGYKKQPVPVRTKATLPCGAQWEDGKGFPWLPCRGEQYSDHTKVKGSPSELQPQPGLGAGKQGRARGAGETQQRDQRTLCPPNQSHPSA